MFQNRIMFDRYVVGVVFGFEHLILLVALWLKYAIHPISKPVRLAIARRNYLISQQKDLQVFEGPEVKKKKD